LDDAAPGISHSIWSHPHFVLANAAQFLYVAAQAGIFSFFINYMMTEVPAIPLSWDLLRTTTAANCALLHNWPSHLSRLSHTTGTGTEYIVIFVRLRRSGLSRRAQSDTRYAQNAIAFLGLAQCNARRGNGSERVSKHFCHLGKAKTLAVNQNRYFAAANHFLLGDSPCVSRR
jgi:hypothetical protein